jgi:hypothetical protein
MALIDSASSSLSKVPSIIILKSRNFTAKVFIVLYCPPDKSADTSMNDIRYQLVPSYTQLVTSPDAVTMSVEPPLSVVLVTSYVTAAVEITVMICPGVPSSNVVNVCVEA